MNKDANLSFFDASQINASYFSDFLGDVSVTNGELIKTSRLGTPTSLGPWKIITSKYTTAIENENDKLKVFYSDGTDGDLGSLREVKNRPIDGQGIGLFDGTFDGDNLNFTPLEVGPELSIEGSEIKYLQEYPLGSESATVSQIYRSNVCPHENGYNGKIRRLNTLEKPNWFITLDSDHGFYLEPGSYYLEATAIYFRARDKYIQIEDSSGNVFGVSHMTYGHNTTVKSTNNETSLSATFELESRTKIYMKTMTSGNYYYDANYSGGIGPSITEDNPSNKFAEVNIWRTK